MRLRQICLVASELEPAVRELCSVLGLEVGYRDPGVAEFGLNNAVMPVGTQFLEVVSPVREGTTAGRFLKRRGGDGGYMVILQTDDLAADRDRLASLGVRIVWQIELDDIKTVHLHPRDIGGAIVSLDQPNPPEAWRWGGPDWQAHAATEVVRGIAGVEIEAADPVAMAARWAQLLGLGTPVPVDGVERLALDGGELCFVKAGARGEGVSCVRFFATDPARAGATFDVCGVRFELVRS
jgi:hypothetical protein